MQSLTSCQCSVCCGCFKQHFTIAVRDKHIRDMVCPVCTEPDINDPEHLNSYFSTLDIQVLQEKKKNTETWLKTQQQFYLALRFSQWCLKQSFFVCVTPQLRDCLEPDVYDLFHKKLTELALIKDPKFLWCSHVSDTASLHFHTVHFFLEIALMLKQL